MIFYVLAAALARTPGEAVPGEASTLTPAEVASFTMEAVVESDTYSVAEALALIEERRGRLETCVRAAPCLGQRHTSSVVINLAVDAEGGVVRSAPGLARTGETEGCILSALSLVKIPGPTNIKYTLTFPASPGSAPAAESLDGAGPIILGTLAKEEIDAVVKTRLDIIRKCYKEGLSRDPLLAGKVVVRFVIAMDGTVLRAEVKSSDLGSPDLEACILEQFRALRFPEPKHCGIVVVSYPFIFAPR